MWPVADGARARGAGAAELVCIAVPSKSFREVVAGLPQNGTPLLSLVKGFDPVSGDRLSTVVNGRPVAVLAGPNHAEEIATGLPAGGRHRQRRRGRSRSGSRMRSCRPAFRVYTNGDMLGVEVSAASKNVIALAVGVTDGLGLGDNAKAAVVTRGLAEMRRIGRALKARPETFSGLAGMGDLMVTCWSRHSRNRRAGELMAQGRTADEAVGEIGMTVEGMTTAPVLRGLGRRLGIDVPITEAVCAVLEGGDPNEIGPKLMRRKPKPE